MKTEVNDRREKIHEPFRRTLIRTTLTGLAVSIAFSFGQLKNAPGFNSKFSILFITFIYIGGVIVFIGHYTELFFINYLRFNFSPKYIIQISIRIIYWYVSGCILYNSAMLLRGLLEHKDLFAGNWYLGGIYFIGIELVANLLMQVMIKKSFWNGVY